MLAGEGLHPRRRARACVRRAASATVIDGPFAEAKELVGGYWMIQAKSHGGGDRVGEALPAPTSDIGIEIRQVFEAEDFGERAPGAAGERESRRRAQTAH